MAGVLPSLSSPACSLACSSDTAAGNFPDQQRADAASVILGAARTFQQLQLLQVMWLATSLLVE